MCHMHLRFPPHCCVFKSRQWWLDAQAVFDKEWCVQEHLRFSDMGIEPSRDEVTELLETDLRSVQPAWHLPF